MGIFERINHRFAVVEYPITLHEMNEMKKDFRKSERSYYETTLKALKKTLKLTDKIFGFENVQPTLEQIGFLILTKDEIILSVHKDGLIPSATLERIPMNEIIEVDFEISTETKPSNICEGEIHISYKSEDELKKYIIRSVPIINLDSLVSRIRGFVKAAGSAVTK